MTFDLYKQIKTEPMYESVIPFIDGLVAQGVPLSAIDVNDWHSSICPRVYVTREYGRRYGYRSYQRFNKLNCKRAGAFYNAKS